MNFASRLLLSTFLALFGLALTAPTPSSAAQSAGKLEGAVKSDGSSTVYPITEAVAVEFKKQEPQVKVTVGLSGTGGGFKRFCVAETDICNASRPIKKQEAEQAAKNNVEYIELPVAFDGLSIVVNTANTWVDHLTMAEVRRLYTDTSVKTWKDLRSAWPAEPIAFFSPGTDSGTFDYFKEMVTVEGASIRSDMSVSEDDNVVVKGVIGNPNAIGFFGCAYYFENKDKLKVVPIDSGSGPVEPTHDTIESGQYAPFSRPLFIYVNRRAIERPEVRAFVQFYLQRAGTLAEKVGYVKLPNEIYRRAAKNVQTLRVGTQYLLPDGKHNHGPIAEVYK